MALLDILVAPHPILKSKAKPVEAVTPDIQAFLDSMLETMYAAPGIGLAANQVGDLRRLVVLDCSKEEEGPKPLFLVNPEITWASSEIASYEEGCLSMPDLYGEVERPAEVKVTYLDRDGQAQTLEADGLLAVCIQHEIDHLNGRMFMDHLSSLKKNIMVRKLKKWVKDNGPHARLTNKGGDKAMSRFEREGLH